MPIKVADLPVRVQNEIVAGTVQEEIADFEHRHCIRPRPASACAARPARLFAPLHRRLRLLLELLSAEERALGDLDRVGVRRAQLPNLTRLVVRRGGLRGYLGGSLGG